MKVKIGEHLLAHLVVIGVAVSTAVVNLYFHLPKPVPVLTRVITAQAPDDQWLVDAAQDLQRRLKCYYGYWREFPELVYKELYFDGRPYVVCQIDAPDAAFSGPAVGYWVNEARDAFVILIRDRQGRERYRYRCAAGLFA